MGAFERNQRRNACRKCSATIGLTEMDGAKGDGMPGIIYRVCGSCGHAQPKTTRPRKEKLRESR